MFKIYCAFYLLTALNIYGIYLNKLRCRALVYFCTHFELRYMNRTRDLQHIYFYYYLKLWSGHIKCASELGIMYRNYATGTVPIAVMI